MPVELSKARKGASNAAATGGSRAAGGFSFQARCGAYVAAHVLSGQGLGWLPGMTDDIPGAIAAETGGPGDDLAITLQDGRAVEIQVKRGLSRGARLWDALAALARGVVDGTADFGLLVTCPSASKTVLSGLAKDLERVGDGRTDQLSAIGEEWVHRLTTLRLPLSVSARLRIISLDLSGSHEGAIRLAELQLRPLLQDPCDAASAWEILVADGLRMIEYRGRRTLESLVRVLRARSIALNAASAGPGPLLVRWCEWVARSHEHYNIIGLPCPVPFDSSWIEQNGRVLENELGAPDAFEEALRNYREGVGRAADSTNRSHGSLIGRFYPFCVVLAGPGMGKTTLLAKLARTAAQRGEAVLKVRLSVLAERMRSTGCGFEEGLFALGLDSSGIAPSAAHAAGLDWTILCDGLDECGPLRDTIARQLVGLAIARPDWRIIVTSRTIGYRRGALEGWRHYLLEPLSEDALKRNVASLLETSPDQAESARIAAILKASPAREAIARSPLLLGLAVALALKDGSIGDSEAELYQRMFGLIEAAAIDRARKAQLSNVELARTIDVIGHILITRSTESAEQSLAGVAEVLAKELGCTILEAKRRTELAARYWGDVGLIETIQHDGRTMLAFVHKTFGEFACARFIRDSAAETRTDMLHRAVTLQADPTLEFAAALGLGRESFQVLAPEGEDLPPETIARALTLANHVPDNAIVDLILPVAARAFDQIGRNEDEETDPVGEALARLAPRHCLGIVPAARLSLAADRPVARLAAWVVLLATDEYVSEPALMDAVASLGTTAKSEVTRPSLVGGLVLPRPASFLLQTFALRAAEALLLNGNPEADKAVIALLRHPGLNRLDVVTAVEALLARLERPAIQSEMIEHWYGARNAGCDRYPDLDFGAWDKAAMTSEIAQLEALAGVAEPNPRLVEAATSALPHLSAFKELTHWGNVLANDVWHWQREGWREIEREVIRASARLGIVDPDALAVEAASLLANYDAIRGNMSFAGFRRTGAADTPELDWSRAKDLSLDLWKIEQALHHGSHYLAMLAANLLDGALTDDGKRAEIVERLLKDGDDVALWGGAQLAKGLPRATALRLVTGRLAGSCVDGLEFLFDLLSVIAPAYGRRLGALVAPLLRSARPEVAIAAANFIAAWGKAGQPLQKALEGALVHWTDNPAPTSKYGQASDPRSAVANALAATGKLSHGALLNLLAYCQDRDSKSAVREALIARWRANRAFRSRVLERVEQEELAPYQLALFLEQPIRLGAGERASIIRLAESRSALNRRAVLPIFGWPGFLDKETKRVFRPLLNDEQRDIRLVARKVADATGLSRE